MTMDSIIQSVFDENRPLELAAAIEKVHPELYALAVQRLTEQTQDTELFRTKDTSGPSPD